MTTLTIHARGQASVDEAWERYADPGRWAGWAPQISRVSIDAGRIVAGASGRVHGPAGVPVASFVIEDVDEESRRWAWRVRAGPIRLRLRHGVERDGAGSRTWLIVDGPLPVVLAYAPIARFALRRLVAG